jgi:hypothetical protein
MPASSHSRIVETKVVRFKAPMQEEERDEEAHAMLHVRCALRFPGLVQNLAKPIFPQHMPAPAPAATFSVQTPAPPLPARQPWLVAANPPSVPHFAPNPFFFHSRARPEGCASCLQPGLHVHECPSAQECVRSGLHALGTMCARDTPWSWATGFASPTASRFPMRRWTRT